MLCKGEKLAKGMKKKKATLLPVPLQDDDDILNYGHSKIEVSLSSLSNSWFIR